MSETLISKLGNKEDLSIKNGHLIGVSFHEMALFRYVKCNMNYEITDLRLA